MREDGKDEDILKAAVLTDEELVSLKDRLMSSFNRVGSSGFYTISPENMAPVANAILNVNEKIEQRILQRQQEKLQKESLASAEADAFHKGVPIPQQNQTKLRLGKHNPEV